MQRKPSCFRKLTCLCQDMETFLCRRTLAGHKNDIMSIAGIAQEDAASGPAAVPPGSPDEVRFLHEPMAASYSFQVLTDAVYTGPLLLLFD